MMRIVFFGTPIFAAASLRAILDHGHSVVGVVTAPDREAGRGQQMSASPVKHFALEHQIPILQPENLKDTSFIETLKKWKSDIHVVVAFRMLPEQVWNMPPLGTYNLHASLLPNYRGAAPIHWAIINGETETGVCVFKLRHEIDTGSILEQERVPIGPEETAGELHTRLMIAGASLLAQSLEKIGSGKFELKPQDDVPDLKPAPRLYRTDCKIDWNQNAETIRNRIRGLAPIPGAYTEVAIKGEKQLWKILKATLSSEMASSPACLKSESGSLYISAADLWLRIDELQPQGKRRMSGKDFVNGLKTSIEKISILTPDQ